jgi:hypothetical protein
MGALVGVLTAGALARLLGERRAADLESASPRHGAQDAPRRSARWPFSDDELRAMYVGGRGNATARRFARCWGLVHAIGVLPRRWVTLEVVGRRGRATRVPVGMADWRGEWFVVSMLGEHCNWVQNVRAADGHVVLCRRGRTAHRLVEIPVADRAPILKRYVAKVPGGRPHIPVPRHASLSEFAVIADRYPVFAVRTR